MTGRNYEKLSETVGADGFTAWQEPIRRGYRMRCCDCGLVHVMDFRIRGRRLEFRIARDNRATAASRARRTPNSSLLLHDLIRFFKARFQAHRPRAPR